MNRLETELKAIFGARLAAGRPLAEFTSFRIGGPADLLVEVRDIGELSAALAAADRCNTPSFCLGAGTNLLVSDRGIRGLVVRLGGALREVKIDGAHVASGAAVQFGELVEMVVDRGLAGLEFGEG